MYHLFGFFCFVFLNSCPSCLYSLIHWGNFQVTKAFVTEDISKCFSKKISCLNNTINDGGIPILILILVLILTGEYYIHLCK